MLKGDSQVGFDSSKPRDEVLKMVEMELENIGNISISSRGGFEISGSKYTGAFHKTTIDGRVSDRDGRYTVQVEFNVKPSILAWVLAICLFPIGLLGLAFPYMAKGDVQRKVEQALSEIRRLN